MKHPIYLLWKCFHWTDLLFAALGWLCHIEGSRDGVFLGNGFLAIPFFAISFRIGVILHEIGHALADASYAAAQRDLMAAVSEYQTDENKLSKWIETREGDAPTVAEVDEFLDKIHRVEVSVHRIKHVGAEGPVIRAFRRARGQSRGPTRYGEDDIEESFAECFALFRADPDALRRIDPDAFAWFSAQGHLSSLAH